MTSTTAPASAGAGLVITEVVESLTGYDEAKIEQQFGAPVEGLGGAKFVRAVLFGHLLHAGVEAKAAHKQVMSMTQAEVSAHFRDDDEEDADGADPAAAGPPVYELGHELTVAGPDPAAGEPVAGDADVAHLPPRAVADAPQA